MNASIGVMRWFVAIGLPLVLGACSLAPSYTRPDSPVPSSWPGEKPPERVAPSGLEVPVDEVAWREFVLDPDLRSIVAAGLVNNRDVMAAVLAVEAARAQYRITRSDRIPGLDAQGTGQRQRMPGALQGTGVQEQAQAGIALPAFELDLFGRLRNQSEAAMREFLATSQGERAARLALISEISVAFTRYHAAKARRHILDRARQGRVDKLGLIEARFRAGVDSEGEFRDAQSLVAEAEAQLHRANADLDHARNALFLLAGTRDIPLSSHLGQRTEFAFLAELRAGLPSDLLERRPDIIAAEQRLVARHADIGAARAAFFPSISLTGFLGSASDDFDGLFEGGTRAWQFSPSIRVPIFSGGRNRAGLELAHVRRDAAVVVYEQTIEVAFTEVADALSSLKHLGEERASQARSTAASLRSRDLAGLRYHAGVDSNLRFIEAERRSLAEQIRLIEVSALRQEVLAALFKSLGGGWVPLAEPV